MAALAPVPSARVRIATIENAGFRRSSRAYTRILPGGVEQTNGIHVVDLFADSRGVSQLSVGRARRFFWRHSTRDVVVNFVRQIVLQFAQRARHPTGRGEESVTTTWLRPRLISRPENSAAALPIPHITPQDNLPETPLSIRNRRIVGPSIQRRYSRGRVPAPMALICPVMRVTSTFPTPGTSPPGLRLRTSGGATTLRPADHRRLGAQRRGHTGVRADVGIRDGRIAAIGTLADRDGCAAHRCVRADGRARLHRHAQPLGLHDPRRAQIREHDPAGRDDDGAGRVAIGRTGQDRAQTRRAREPTARPSTGRRSAAISRSSSGSTCRRTSRRTSAKSRSGPTSKATASPRRRRRSSTTMKKLIAQAMEEGAMGLSTALLEPPSSIATTANLIELAKVGEAVRRHLLVAHPRRRRRRLPRHRRGDSGRQGREDPGRYPPHEDRAQEAVGPRERDHRDGPEGARRGPQHPGERLSRTRRDRTICRRSFRRGRTTAAARRCWSGSGSGGAEAHARRSHERAAELVQPLPRDGRWLGAA